MIPNGLAILATESNKKVLQEKIKQSQNKQKKAIDEANKIVKKLVRSMYFKIDNGLLINALESNVYKEVIIRQRLRIFNDMENLISKLVIDLANVRATLDLKNLQN